MTKVLPLPVWLPPLLFAPFAGSFIGVLVRRLPRDLPVVIDRSRCESCGRPIAPWDLVPVLSFVVLRGRCRGCGARIAAGHLGAELGAAGIAVWAALATAEPTVIWMTCVLGWTLFALGWIDWICMRLPDVLTLPLVLAGLGAALLLDPAAAPEHAGAAVLGYSLLRGVGLGYRVLRGREGLGVGDAKLLAAGAAWTGVAGIPYVLLVGAVLSLGLVFTEWVRGRVVTGATPIPFGPGLCGAIWLIWLYALPPM